MGTKKRKLYKSFNPEKYKMILCPSCGGMGKSSNGNEEVEVCSRCGGFGWVKKEEEGA
jgi:DnaJ-class molecular chaperone